MHVPAVRISDAEIDRLIQEDVPYLDLTTHVLQVGEVPARMEYFTREACVLCASEEAARVAERLGCRVTDMRPSGSEVSAGESFLVLEGTGEDVHAAWKVCLNLLDHLSAVATKTHAMVQAAHEVNPRCEVLTTRKSMPGVKSLLTKAVLSGGGFPHRLGLSETVLVFEQHVKLMGGYDALEAQLPQIKAHTVEKKLFVECGPDLAARMVRAGADGIQLDKVAPADIPPLLSELRAIDPGVCVIAAGGISPDNVAAYAATGVDGIVTTSPFTAKPVDMSVRVSRT